MACKLCVGVPVYNEVEFLDRTLTSLMRQNTPEVMFLISDNCSTDGSWELIEKYCELDGRFIAKRQSSNLGALSNLEFLFLESESPYFMWLGAHDYISDFFIESAISFLDTHSETSCVSGLPYGFIGDSPPQYMPEAVYDFSDRRVERYFQSIEKIRNCTIFHSIFRANALQDFEFRKTRGFDHVLISRLLWHGRLHYLQDQAYYRRYFEASRVDGGAERISGFKDTLPIYDMIVYYLDDLQRLYQGDPRLLRFLEARVVNCLSEIYTIQSVHRPDDMEYWSGRVT